MTTKGFDCASPLTLEKAKQFKSAGYDFVARYLVPSSWKAMGKAEADVIKAAGLKIVSVYESTASRALGGADAGKADGKTANNIAVAVGQTAGSTIYFAVDFDAQSIHFNAIEQYLKAAGEQVKGYGFEVGVYGSYAVCEEMNKRKACTKFWQTYAWSGGKKSSVRNVFQYKNGVSENGMSIDFDEGYGSEGAWGAIAAQPTPTPQPVPKPVEPPKPVVKIVDGTKDVHTDAWYANAVTHAVANGLMSVDDNGDFNPDAPVSRAMMAQILLNIKVNM